MSGGLWVASYVALWLTVLLLAVAVIALLRQIGVLHTRVRPMGGHPGGEGPVPGSRAPLGEHFQWQRAALTALAFTSPTCSLCRTLEPGLRALARGYRDLRLETVSHGPAVTEVFEAFNVASTPYLVCVDSAGFVRAAGIVNTLDQAEVLLDQARSGAGADG